MPSETGHPLDPGFEELFTAEALREAPERLPINRRRGGSRAPPAGMERRGRVHRAFGGMLLLAFLCHALPVAAFVLLDRLELLGAASDGGTGWACPYLVVWKGEPDLPSGPAEPPDAIPPLPQDPPSELEEEPPVTPALAMSSVTPRPARAGGGSGGPVHGEGESMGSAGELEAPVWNPRPAYPASARKAGWEGMVGIALEVGADGRVRKARLLSSSGHEVLDGAALDALRRWRFAPRGLRGSVKVIRLEVVFRLEGAVAVSTFK